MAPRPEYALWWKLTERCAGRTADLGDFHWYVVPGVAVFSDKQLEGEENSTTKRIILAGKMVDSGGVVRHEMLHALLSQHGHPAEYFQQKCAGVVGCPLRCEEDGGFRVDDTTAVIVPLDSEEVSASMDPSNPSVAQDSGWFAITVRVHNPDPFPVRVRLATISSIPPITFGWRARVCGHTGEILGQSVRASDTLFAIGPHGVRRWEFDLHVSGTCLIYQPYFNTSSLSETQVAAAP